LFFLILKNILRNIFSGRKYFSLFSLVKKFLFQENNSWNKFFFLEIRKRFFAVYTLGVITRVMAGRVFRPLCIFAVLFVIFWLIGLAVHPNCSSEHSLNISFANTNFHVVYRWRWRSLANKYRSRHSVINSGVANSIIGEANIHIFVFTDLKNNWLQRKLIRQNANIWILPPSPQLSSLLRHWLLSLLNMVRLVWFWHLGLSLWILLFVWTFQEIRVHANNVAYVHTKLNIVHNFTCGSSSTLRSGNFDYNYYSRLSSFNNVIGNCVGSWPLYIGVNSHAYNSLCMDLAGTYTQGIPSTSSIPVIIRERPAIITKPVIRARNNLLQINLDGSPSNCQQNPTGPVNFCVWNCQSVRNKTACLSPPHTSATCWANRLARQLAQLCIFTAHVGKSTQQQHN
jgi:hypothetical protein